MSQRAQLSSLLDDLQPELDQQGLWATQPPFFADTMNFSEWLQWVFIARFRAILEADHPLPGQCDIAPMAEEALKGMEQDVTGIINLIKQFDDQF